MIRYYAFVADCNHRFFEEILVEMEPGKFKDRRETKTGVLYQTMQQASAAMRAKNWHMTDRQQRIVTREG